MTAVPPRWPSTAARECTADRRALRARGRERGSAIVEFIALAVVLLVPLVYLVLLLSRVQAASYAVAVAAREGGRVFVAAPADVDAHTTATSAARLAFEDQGFAGSGDVAFECAANPCRTPEAQVTARARLRVSLPLVPDVVAVALPLAVPVEATYVTTVERFGTSSGASL